MESFIKAGALDSLPGTRKQKMSIYINILDGVNHNVFGYLSGMLHKRRHKRRHKLYRIMAFQIGRLIEIYRGKK